MKKQEAKKAYLSTGKICKPVHTNSTIISIETRHTI